MLQVFDIYYKNACLKLQYFKTCSICVRVLRPVKIIPFYLGIVNCKVGQKREIPE